MITESGGGTNPKKKCQEEIDFVAVGSDKILTGECKWTEKKVGYQEFHTLVERSNLIRKNREIGYYLFSKSGFEEKLMEKKEKNLMLVTVEDMVF